MSPIPVHLRLVRWFCGFEEGEEAERHHQQLEQHLEVDLRIVTVLLPDG